MSVRASAWAWQQQSRCSPGAGKVLLALADHADGDGICWPGRTGVAAKCVLSAASVKRHIRELGGAGLIRTEPRHDGRGRQTSNLYHLLIRVEGEGVNLTPRGVTRDPGGGSAVTPPSESSNESPSSARPSGSHSRARARGGAEKKTKLNLDHLPAGITADLAAELIDYRQQIKKPIATQRELDGLLGVLSAAPQVGFAPGEALGEMQMAGWRSIRLEWLANRRRTGGIGENHGTHSDNRKLSAVERTIRAGAERIEREGDATPSGIIPFGG